MLAWPQKAVCEIECPDKQQVSSPILLQGFANSDKSESNPNKQLSDERKLPVSAIRDLSPISSQARLGQSGDSHLLSSPRQSPSPRILGSAASPSRPSSSPHSVPTSPVVSGPSVTSAAPGAGLNFGNPFGLAAGRNFLSSPGLLPPGMNPFFPHAGMMLANPFQRFPGKLTGGSQQDNYQLGAVPSIIICD